jgi:hypothetical protein
MASDDNPEHIELDISRLPISLPCPIPVLPNTPRTDADAEAKTDTCRVDAWWMVGFAVICDVHFRQMCELVGEDYDDIVAQLRRDCPEFADADIPNMTESQPWERMYRYADKPVDVRNRETSERMTRELTQQ